MRIIAFFISMILCVSLKAQGFSLRIQPVIWGRKIVLEQPLHGPGGDSLIISTLKFYLGNFEFWKNGHRVFVEKDYRLIDLEDENTLRLPFNFQGNMAFDSISLDLGVDSLTTAAGAMGGDLDPTRGMFWTWQSGYINFKVEGIYSKSDVRTGRFVFHLGGHLPPFQAHRRIKTGLVSTSAAGMLEFDLSSFFENIDLQSKLSIMSPGAEAMRLMDVLVNALHTHEN